MVLPLVLLALHSSIALAQWVPSTNCPKQHYNDDHGVIYSPNFPQNYDNNDNCTYTITVLTGKRVELIFFAFRSEACCDTLNVYDGDVPDSRHRLASLSGDNHEGRIFQSSANELTLEFISDITVVNQGFYAKYHTLTGNASTTPPTTTCTNVTLTTHFGFVTSPNWPSDYPNGVTCSSVIDAGYGKTVSFEILDMDIEPCCDFLNIYDGNTTSASAQLASVNGLLQNLKQKKFKSTGASLLT
ncbi:hypothetical protein L596_011150 [Steinernema carpocapsae]|uniref:CUB domain-containing protein n=1 Tax=Steinernema carpocapsae TaxID=34508 RepID=A0A4U5NTX5_STECR|nr:hypothetical protein L596_011150 [Steinernema carpocapsae]